MSQRLWGLQVLGAHSTLQRKAQEANALSIPKAAKLNITLALSLCRLNQWHPAEKSLAATVPKASHLEDGGGEHGTLRNA